MYVTAKCHRGTISQLSCKLLATSEPPYTSFTAMLWLFCSHLVEICHRTVLIIINSNLTKLLRRAKGSHSLGLYHPKNLLPQRTKGSRPRHLYHQGSVYHSYLLSPNPQIPSSIVCNKRSMLFRQKVHAVVKEKSKVKWPHHRQRLVIIIVIIIVIHRRVSWGTHETTWTFPLSV